MISRRNFLKALIGIGAYAALPFDLSQASEAQVDEAWAKLGQKPSVFEVEGKTIYAPWADDCPSVYGDVFDVPSNFKNRSQLISEFDCCYELQSHFEKAFEDAALEEKSLAARLYDRNGAEGFDLWIKKTPLADLNAEVESWLNTALPCGFEYPLQCGPMGEAYGFFQRQGSEFLDALGVEIVEGEHPGSSYYAAELTVPVADANYAAAVLDIPIRFKEVG